VIVWWLGIVCGASAVVVGSAAAYWHRRTTQRLRAGERELALKTAELERREALRAQIESRYRNLFDSVPVAIIVSRIDGSVIDVNSAGLQLFGYPRAEFMALNLRSIYVNPAERDRRMASALAEAVPRPGEFLLRRKDGSTFPALIQNQIIRDAQGEPGPVEGFVTDVSEMKRLESERLKVAQENRISTRLQSVGALAAGIAHEINTPMQFVSDSVYFIKRAIEDLNGFWQGIAPLSGETDSAVKRIHEAAAAIEIEELIADTRQSAERALEGVRRVTKIIRAMREFAHPDSGERTLVDVNHALETTLTVCRNVYKEVADVKTDWGTLPQITCQYGEINQAFLNIIVNAAHAIEARITRTERGLIAVSTAAEDGFAVIRITDNGSGIPESVKARIFDPFFTTKEVGKGTGQGLAIVQSVIVERHKGRISVESEVGKGTTFVLRLPIENPKLESPKPEANGAEDEQEA
jgi:two-component system, NtrC family, sensor kinase